MPMTKIASPHELRHRLRSLMDYAKGPQKPSRRTVARELRGMATGLLSQRRERSVTAASMSEGEFWKIIEPYRWGRGNTNSRAIKKDLMRKLTPDQAEALTNTFDKLKGQADRALGDYFEAKGAWVGGDSWDDFLSHIVGLGKREFETHVKDKDRALARFSKGDYTESFAYALPAKYDYESLDVDKYVKWAKRNAELFKTILGASKDDIPWKDKIKRDLQLLVKAHEDFVRTKDYHEFVKHEDTVKKAAENVEQTLRRINTGWMPEEGSLDDAIRQAANKWATWNLFSDIHQYLL